MFVDTTRVVLYFYSRANCKHVKYGLCARGTKKRANTTTAYTIASESFYATAIEPITGKIIQKIKKRKPVDNTASHALNRLDWNRHRWLKTFNAESVQLSSLLRWEVVHFYSFNIKLVERISDCRGPCVRCLNRSYHWAFPRFTCAFNISNKSEGKKRKHEPLKPCRCV